MKILFAHQRPANISRTLGKREIKMQPNFYIPQSRNKDSAKRTFYNTSSLNLNFSGMVSRHDFPQSISPSVSDLHGIAAFIQMKVLDHMYSVKLINKQCCMEIVQRLEECLHESTHKNI